MRWKIAVGVGLLAVVFAVVFLWLRKEAPKLTHYQVERIEVGMTREDVEAIFGCQPGNYTYTDDGLPPQVDMRFYAKEQEIQAPFKEWAADQPEPSFTDPNGAYRQEAIAVRVWFNEQGKVIDKCIMGYSYACRAPSPSDYLRRLLHRW